MSPYHPGYVLSRRNDFISFPTKKHTRVLERRMWSKMYTVGHSKLLLMPATFTPENQKTLKAPAKRMTAQCSQTTCKKTES